MEANDLLIRDWLLVRAGVVDLVGGHCKAYN